jgi:hypothetical protein
MSSIAKELAYFERGREKGCLRAIPATLPRSAFALNAAIRHDGLQCLVAVTRLETGSSPTSESQPSDAILRPMILFSSPFSGATT